MDAISTIAPSPAPLRTFVPRRALTTFATPLVKPSSSPQHEQEVAGLLARTLAYRRGQSEAASALPVGPRDIGPA